MQVVYRLCQLWFSLGQEEAVVNKALGEALAEVPSHKWVPLVYQAASRLGAAKEAKGEARAQAQAFQVGWGVGGWAGRDSYWRTPAAHCCVAACYSSAALLCRPAVPNPNLA